MAKALFFSVYFRSALFIGLSFLFYSCQEKPFTDRELIPKRLPVFLNKDTDSTIFISQSIIISDKGKVRDTLFSYSVFEKLLENMVNSGRFLFVPVKELNSTFSKDKVIVALRHDIDWDIPSSVRFARREHKLGIRGTYFVLHTADYYSRTSALKERYIKYTNSSSIRKPDVLEYLKKIQNDYNHEIGWHNDLVTLQVVYNIDAGQYLSDELKWLRSNNIVIEGTSSHGSEYCYKYHYLNAFFWKGFAQDDFFKHNEYAIVDGVYKKITKYSLSDFGFKYESNLLRFNRFYADAFKVNNKPWHLKMLNWESLVPGDKVLIILHPGRWDSF